MKIGKPGAMVSNLVVWTEQKPVTTEVIREPFCSFQGLEILLQGIWILLQPLTVVPYITNYISNNTHSPLKVPSQKTSSHQWGIRTP
jgi:hypothetical protein